MNNHHEKPAEMRTKLREGLDLLSNAGEDDIAGLNGALIKIHGAMEDFVRLEVAGAAPELQGQVEDAGQVKWKDLLEYSRKYLRFTFEDTRRISSMNSYRQTVAHGGNYEGSRFDLDEYAGFVYRKFYPGKSVPNLAYRNAITPPYPASQMPQETASTTSKRKQTTVHPPRKPWYRSLLFLVLTFFLLPPLWAVLIITDRRQGCLAKGYAYSLLLVLGLFFLGVFSPYGLSLDVLQDLIQQVTVHRAPQTRQDSATGKSPVVRAEATPLLPAKSSVTEAACAIVWVEVPSDGLAAKNRSMVWEAIVRDQVRGSGMTDHQFYDQVVEKNPVLKTDGYEFKRGKSYLLPKCQ